MDQLQESLCIDTPVRVVVFVAFVRHGFDFLQAHQRSRFAPALADDMRYGRVVRDTIDPCPKRAPRFKTCKAAPKRDVYLLDQIATLVRVCLVCLTQAIERITEFGNSPGIEFIWRGRLLR